MLTDEESVTAGGDGANGDEYSEGLHRLCFELGAACVAVWCFAKVLLRWRLGEGNMKSFYARLDHVVWNDNPREYWIIEVAFPS